MSTVHTTRLLRIVGSIGSLTALPLLMRGHIMLKFFVLPLVRRCFLGFGHIRRVTWSGRHLLMLWIGLVQWGIWGRTKSVSLLMAYASFRRSLTFGLQRRQLLFHPVQVPLRLFGLGAFLALTKQFNGQKLSQGRWRQVAGTLWGSLGRWCRPLTLAKLPLFLLTMRTCGNSSSIAWKDAFPPSLFGSRLIEIGLGLRDSIRSWLVAMLLLTKSPPSKLFIITRLRLLCTSR